jgi:hypothetical protein
MSGGDGADEAGGQPFDGADTYSGGSGVDYMSYAALPDSVEVSLDGVANDGAAGEADNIGVFQDVEDVFGGQGDDRLIGNAAGNFLYGEYGDDEIIGGPGDDRLYGGDGADRILALDNVLANDTTDGGYSPMDLCTSDTRGVVADMTASTQQAAATTPPAPPELHRGRDAILRPRRRPSHVGRMHVMRILVLELVAVALLAAVALSPLAALAVVAVAVPLLVVTFGRIQGHWWLERRALARGYRRRRRGRPAPSVDPRLSALRALAPNLGVQTVRAADGSQVGVGRDDAGWFAVAAVLPATPMSDEPGAHLPLDLLIPVLAETAQPGAILQVVRQTIAAPGLAVDPDSPVGQSYRLLLANTGPLPLDQTTWVAVRRAWVSRCAMPGSCARCSTRRR